MYYQYPILEIIEVKMRNGEVISGFSLPGSTKILVAYGDGCRSGTMSVVIVRRVDRGNSKI